MQDKVLCFSTIFLTTKTTSNYKKNKNIHIKQPNFKTKTVNSRNFTFKLTYVSQNFMHHLFNYKKLQLKKKTFFASNCIRGIYI